MPKKRYSVGYLTTDYKTIVVSPDNLGVELKWMWITNRGGSAAKVEIAHVPQGSTAGETLDLVHDYSVDSEAYVVSEIGIYLEGGDQIVAKSNTADSIVLTFYGVDEYSNRNAPDSPFAFDTTIDIGDPNYRRKL